MGFTTKITRLRAPTVVGSDGVGYQDWDAPEASWDKLDFYAYMHPIRSTEDVVAQQRVESTHVAVVDPLLDEDTAERVIDIVATDRIRKKGMDYQVDGDPLMHDDLAGRLHHARVYCFRLTGG